MKTFKCLTTFDHVSFTGSVTSPKTGRVLRLDRRSMKYLSPALLKALQAVSPVGMAHFTVQDLRDFLEASEASRDEYKDALAHEFGECVASEETDGECPHCEAQMFGR